MDPRQYKATISQNKAINKFLEEGYYVFANVCEQGQIDGSGELRLQFNANIANQSLKEVE